MQDGHKTNEDEGFVLKGKSKNATSCRRWVFVSKEEKDTSEKR
jgi:hypothetical protein